MMAAAGIVKNGQTFLPLGALFLSTTIRSSFWPQTDALEDVSTDIYPKLVPVGLNPRFVHVWYTDQYED
jgi:hypothetical protein